MSQQLLTQEVLMQWSDTKTRPALERWLNLNKIPFAINSKRKIVTTISAVNAGILGTVQANEIEHV